MTSSRVLRAVAAFTVLTAFVGACGDDDDDGGAAEEVEAQAISITAVDYEFSDAPTELEAGLVEIDFTNDGEVDHEAAFVEIGDTSLEDFLTAFEPVITGEGAPFPDEAGAVAVPIEAAGGEDASATFLLSEGTYALFCALEGDADDPEPAEGDEGEGEGEGEGGEGTGEQGEGEGEGGEGDEEPVDPAKLHFNRGMAELVTVTAGTADAALPGADGSVTASDWTFEADLESGDRTLNFVNDGPDEIHFAAIFEYPAGTDVATAEESFAGFFSDEGPPEGSVEPDNEDFGFTGLYSTGLGGQIELDAPIESGKTYLLACFISDRAGGPPHAFPEAMGGHGMYRAFVVE